MTTATLAIIIFVAIVAQLGVFILLHIYRANRNLSQGAKQIENVPAAGHIATQNQTREPSLANQWMECTVQRREYENKDRSICSYYLAAVDGKPLPDFLPGQYLTFKLNIDDALTQQKKAIIRCYSLSDAPRADYYRVSIKRVSAPADQPELPDGMASSYFHDVIQPGSRLLIKPPCGQFHLQAEQALPVVLIGGGIGITPMLSIVNTLLQQGSEREIWLFYGVQDSQSHIMKQHLTTLAESHANFHLHVCYSNPGENDQLGVDYQHQGRVDVALLRNTLNMTRYQFYICGPAGMMQSMVSGLQDWGIPDKDIFYESFGPSSIKQVKKTAIKKSEQIPGSVTFKKSGKCLSWDSSYESLLEFAEDNHIEIESGCRSGSCGACQTPVQSGELDLIQEPDFDIPPGHCLMCISTPRGNLTLDA